MQLFAIAFAFILVILAGVAIGALFAFPVMWLWNYLLADAATSILGAALPPLDFWHAWALLVLCGLLVKGTSAAPGSGNKS